MFVDKKIEPTDSDEEEIVTVEVEDDDTLETGHQNLDKVIPADEREPEPEETDDTPPKSAKDRRTPGERIAEITRKHREAERERDFERQERAKLQAEVTRYKQQVGQADDVLISTRGEKYAADLEKARKAYRDAINTGDVDAQLEATEEISKARYKLEENERIVQGRAYRKQQEEQAPPPEQQAARPQADNSLAVEWAEKNKSWFNKDPALSGAAFGIDAALKAEGMDPAAPEYYQELDKRMKEYFPSKFSGEARARPHNPVAPVSRGPAKGARQVPLDAGQRAMAAKLGVPLNEYAKYVKGDTK